jgi:AcrR family transcriptional regulator
VSSVAAPSRRTAETREKILEAAMSLCMERGPLSVSMGEIAAAAGVERITLYRHFGDEGGLHRAVGAYCVARFPPPRPEPLRAITNPVARTRRALEQLYAHWERMGPMVRPILRDADVAPERVSLELRDRYVNAIRAAVVAGFPMPMRGRAPLRDAVRHAFDFRTWDSLDRGGFTRGRAVALMTALVVGASGRSAHRRRSAFATEV